MDKQLHLPEFFIIGAAKCATTDLAAVLRHHQSIDMCKDKETFFFSRDDIIYRPERFLSNPELWGTFDWERNRDALLSQYVETFFEDVPPDLVRGEATAEYIIFHEAADRIREAIPNAKLIIMLREPVKRLTSAYWFRVQMGQTCRRPERWIALDGSRELRVGLYRQHLEYWLSVFPRDQVHVVVFEEYINPKMRQSVVDGVCRFLGVESTLNVSKLAVFSNKTAAPRSIRLELALNAIRMRYGLPGPTVRWYEPASLGGRIVDRILLGISSLNNSFDRRYLAFSPLLSERLETYYRHENAGLTELIGRDVDAIWYGGEKKANNGDDRLFAAIK